MRPQKTVIEEVIEDLEELARSYKMEAKTNSVLDYRSKSFYDISSHIEKALENLSAAFTIIEEKEKFN